MACRHEDNIEPRVSLCTKSLAGGCRRPEACGGREVCTRLVNYYNAPWRAMESPREGAAAWCLEDTLITCQRTL